MSLHYPFDQLPAAGAALEIASGIRWVRMPLPFALDHINLWLLEDGAGWAAVDTGICLDGLKDNWRSLLTQHRLTRQIVTHCHPDHLGLSAWLEQQSGAKLWITQGEFAVGHLLRAGTDGFGLAAMMRFYRQHGLDEARLAAQEGRGNGFLKGVPEMPMTFTRMLDDDQIAIGRHVWRVMVGYGHSPEHAALYCDELQVLISGDMLLPRISTNVHVNAASPDADALGLFLASIDRFQQLPPDTLVLPSHGKPFRGLHARVAQLQQHHRDRCETLLAACATPKCARELLPVLFDRDITDPHQVMFAMGETIAHLNYLEKKQAIVRTDDDGILQFSRAI